MLDYDREASRYDETRGGAARAEEAARAILSLAPPRTRVILDLAGGTGIVAERLRRHGTGVAVADRSHGMLVHARERLPGRVLRCDATRLPLHDASVDVVAAIWLLHLVRDPEAVLVEAVRVIRPGGRFITTVDKDASHGIPTGYASDAEPLVTRLAGRHGLSPAGSAMFVGAGMGHDCAPDPIFELRAYEKG
jgi:ubiquinone/menaquinone biosynthesis C-methylase UbiE